MADSLLGEEDTQSKASSGAASSSPVKEETKRLEKWNEYMKYAKTVAGWLNPNMPKNTVLFFSELFAEVTPDMKAVNIKEVLDFLTKIYNNKLEEERKADNKAKKVGGGSKVDHGKLAENKNF